MNTNIRILFRFFMIFSILFVITTSTVNAAQQDFSSNHTYKNEALEQLIEVWAYDTDYDQEEAQKMIDRIAVIPERMIKKSLEEGIKLLFIDFPLTELPEFEYLSGEVPRGWEDTGYTWDDVPGAGGLTSVAIIGHSNPDNVHDSINLEYHEFGHAIDDYMLGYSINKLDEFIDIHTAEKYDLWGDDDYLDYIGEYFAESISLYFLGGDHKARLKENAPKTYKFMDTLNERILSVEENNELGVAFSWETIEDAVYYEVYRDEDKINETAIPVFTDITFMDNSFHQYYIQAINEAGVIMNETFVAEVITGELAIPEKPINIAGDITNDTMVSLTWDPVVNAEEYEVLRNDEVMTTITAHEYIDETIELNEVYNYTIRAVNRAGTSADSSEVKISLVEEELDEAEPKEVENVDENITETDDYSINVILVVLLSIVVIVPIIIFILRIRK